MIEKKIEELFSTVEDSSLYKEYKEVLRCISLDERINDLIREIKKLKQETVQLKQRNDKREKEVEKIFLMKMEELNNIPLYREYINKKDALEEILKSSSFMISEYIKEKI